MDRRSFCFSAAAALAATQSGTLAALVPSVPANGPLITLKEIEAIDRERILRAANEYLPQPPITIQHRLRRAAKAASTTTFPRRITGGRTPRIPTARTSSAMATPIRRTSTIIGLR